ncbi:MAG: UPF0280 family protein [Bacillota bacterium]|nr:UPF0280 family protein [Bacillota bacterium]
MSSNRFYRHRIAEPRLTSFSVAIKETDLWIAVSRDTYHAELPSLVEKQIWNMRQPLESYLKEHPEILASLKPCILTPDAPEILKVMTRAGNRAGVGPMAAVAGAFAEAVGIYINSFSPEVIVENGGDIYLNVEKPVTVGIYAGNSPLSGKLALRVNPENTPSGICTSSGTVGPSISFGNADAAIVVSQSAPLADAVATALGNLVKNPDDMESAIDFGKSIEGIKGILIIYGSRVAAWGSIELKN